MIKIRKTGIFIAGNFYRFDEREGERQYVE